MNAEEAREIYYQIVDLCYEIDSPRLNELLEPITRGVEGFENEKDIAASAEELQVHLNEMDFFDEEESIVLEIHSLIEKLSE